MIDSVIELLAAFMRHPEHGVNALAAEVPRAHIGKADGEAPPSVTVVADLEEKGVAEQLDPAKVPALMMWMDSFVDIDYRGLKRAKEVIIAAGFVTDWGAPALQSIQACGYILRGARLCMERYNVQGYARAPGGIDYRQLNGVFVQEIRSVTERRFTATGKASKRRMWGLIDIRAVAVETLK